MAIPYPDPSNPALPSPLFSDITAVRGDHLRANNNAIFADLTYLDNLVAANWVRTIYGDNEYGSTLVTDLDAITKSGFYTCYGAATGAPSSLYSWFVLHQNSAVGTVSAYQRAVAFSTNAIVYERTKISSTWGAWKLVGGEVTTVALSGATHTLTDDSLRASMVIFSGATSTVTITWPATIIRQCRFKNPTAYTLYIKTASGTGVYLFAGDVWDLYCDGTNVVPIMRNKNNVIGYEQMTADTYAGYPVFEKVIDTGALPASGEKNTPHGISGSFTILPDVGVSGMTTNGSIQRPIPGPATASVGSIQVAVNSTNITIGTSTDLSAYTKSWVKLRYVKVSL